MTSKASTDTLKYHLACAHRILASLGIDDHTYTHLSVRSPQKPPFEGMYISRFGYRFEEMHPDLLVEATLDGHELSAAPTSESLAYTKSLTLNVTGSVTHSHIYKARPDVQAIFHIHTPAIVAVSATTEGLLPISQWALHFYESVAYHDYASLAVEAETGAVLAKDMGPHPVMLMRNHGAMICGATIQEALYFTYHLDQACKTQCLTGHKRTHLVWPDESICEDAHRELMDFEPVRGMRDWSAWMRTLERRNMLPV